MNINYFSRYERTKCYRDSTQQKTTNYFGRPVGKNDIEN